METNTVKQAISNLEAMSTALYTVANRDQNYNSDYALYLEHLSFEMHKHANELKECEYLFGEIL